MICDLEFTGDVNENGWRRTRCKRDDCGIQGGWTPDEMDKIRAPQCQGWPHRWEVLNWAEFAVSVVGLAGPYQYLRVTDFSARHLLGNGPGTELFDLLLSLGVSETLDCECLSRAKQMNDWGVLGCREHADEISGWMRDGLDKCSLSKRRLAMLLAVRTGVAWRLSWRNPIPSLIAEALRRSDARDH